MKSKLLALLFASFLVTAQAQIQESFQQKKKIGQCASSLLPKDKLAYEELVRKEKEFVTLRDNGFLHLPVQFHLLRNSSGLGGIDAEQAAWELARANEKFASASIDFFQCSPPQFIDDGDYFDTVFDYEWEDSCGQDNPEYNIANENNVPNVINLYYVNTDGWNWSSFPSALNNDCKDWIILNIADTGTTYLLAHEMGHYFYLLHTFETTGDDASEDEENITRNSNSSCYNCETVGDYLCDTEADPNNWNSSCGWDGTGTDDCSNSSYNPDPQNIMSYANGCQEYFTAGQAGRIVYAADFLRSYLSCAYVSDCNSSWDLSETQDFQYAYQTSDFITSTATVNSGITSAYNATTYITLKPGFTATSGCDFRAHIDGCWGVEIYKENEPQADIKNNSEINNSFSLFPNPATVYTRIVYKASGETCTIKISNAIGQQVFEQTFKNESQQEKEIDVSKFPKGIYFVSLQANSHSQMLPLIIQ